MSVAELVMRKFYRDADGAAERLPWHRDSPSPLLESAREAHPGPVRALDVGCGAGVLSVCLAERGADVTGIDMFPEAIAMARALAEKRATKVDFVTGDLFEYAAERRSTSCTTRGVCTRSSEATSVATSRSCSAGSRPRDPTCSNTGASDTLSTGVRSGRADEPSRPSSGCSHPSASCSRPT
jgi:Methyltransferase domain